MTEKHLRTTQVLAKLQSHRSRSNLKTSVSSWIRGSSLKAVGPDGEEVAAFSDPYTLNLCDILNGYHLHDWQKTISSLSEKEFAIRLIYGTVRLYPCFGTFLLTGSFKALTVCRFIYVSLVRTEEKKRVPEGFRGPVV